MKKNNASDEILKQLRARIAKSPRSSGIYRWLDSEGTVLYIGKAKDLRSRLKSYVQKRDKSLGPWKLALLERIADFDYTVTANELEALILETNLIKEHRPKYNVLMKDDKNYVYLKITQEDPYPTLEIVRRMENPKATYFGPFLSNFDLRNTLDLLHTIFEWRACKRSIDVLNKMHASSAAQHDIDLKPCIDQQIGRCNGLCLGTLSHEEYRERIRKVIAFFRGDHEEVIERLHVLMNEAASAKQFEKAAKFRDTLHHIESLEEQQVVSGTSGEDTDIFGVALLRSRAQVVLLKEREGKLVQELSFSLQGEAGRSSEVLAQFLPQYYFETTDIPDTILIREPFEGENALEEWLNQKRRTKNQKRVRMHVPERGKKSKLLQMAEANALEKVEQQFAKWEAEDAKLERALQELQTGLGFPNLPKRIECYDISHLSGTETVGSMVVFLDGKAASDHYRSFTLRSIRNGEIDDYKALREVLRRRLRYLIDAEERWKSLGIEFGKARKEEQHVLEGIIERHPDLLSTKDVHTRDFIVARHGGAIVGCGRLLDHAGSIKEIKSVWVDEEHRGQKLGHAVIRKLLEKAKKGKVYVMISSDLHEYYAELGFQRIEKIPMILQAMLDEEQSKNPQCPCGIVMMLEVRKSKLDPSFTSRPDLLVLDGGKGQLSAGEETLRMLRIEIPIIALAKEKEDVFASVIPSSSADPVPLPEDARFLLMRLRDEAHRFANRHRERRAKHALVS